MILIFFFLLFKTIVEREVKYPASGVGFGLKPWAGQTSGVLSLFFFLCGDAMHSLPGGVQQRMMF